MRVQEFTSINKFGEFKSLQLGELIILSKKFTSYALYEIHTYKFLVNFLYRDCFDEVCWSFF